MNKTEAKAQAIHMLYGLLTFTLDAEERNIIKQCIAVIETEVDV